MSEPKVAATRPIVLDLEPGTYHWCTCGGSSRQPFCDGAHRGTGFIPKPFEIHEPQKTSLCACKQTEHPPFCDGAHKRL